MRQVPVNNLSFTGIKYRMLAIKMKRKIKPCHPHPQTLSLLNYCPFPLLLTFYCIQLTPNPLLEIHHMVDHIWKSQEDNLMWLILKTGHENTQEVKSFHPSLNLKLLSLPWHKLLSFNSKVLPVVSPLVLLRILLTKLCLWVPFPVLM